MSTTRQLRQRWFAQARLYLERYYGWIVISIAKCIQIEFFCQIIFQGVICKKTRIFMCFLIFTVLDENKLYLFISCVIFCQFVISNYLWLANFVSLIYLKSQNNEIYEITTTLIDFDCVLYLYMIIYIITDIWSPQMTNSHKIDITGSFKKRIKVIYKWNMILNKWLSDKVRVVWIFYDLFSSIYSNSKMA